MLGPPRRADDDGPRPLPRMWRRWPTVSSGYAELFDRVAGRACRCGCPATAGWGGDEVLHAVAVDIAGGHADAVGGGTAGKLNCAFVMASSLRLSDRRRHRCSDDDGAQRDGLYQRGATVAAKLVSPL